MGDRERLAPETFRLPVEKIRESYYSDSYFALTKELLEAEGCDPRVRMQVFAKKRGAAGRDRRDDRGAEALRAASGHGHLGAGLGAAAGQRPARGHGHVRIVVSGGFTAEKIEGFEQAGAPVDSYGVGSALLRGCFDFTADIVWGEGAPGAKVGRELRPNPRLQPVT